MKSIMYLCILCIETALAVALAAGIVQSYGQVVPPTCLKSRSIHTIQSMCANGGQGKWSNCKSECLAMPMVPTSVPRTISTANGKTRMKMRISPKDSRGESQSLTGYATWCSRQSCRREGTGGKRILMANGKPLDDTKLTAALWIVGKHGRPLKPDGRLVSVRNVETGATVKVAWADNGPGCVPRSRGVICDLTPAAMLALAGPDGIKAGRVKVKIERI